MSTLAKFKLAALWLVLSLAISVVWWRLWIYHGFAGSPGLLTELLEPIGGEAYYDAIWFEMILVSATVLSAAFLILRFLRLRSRR